MAQLSRHRPSNGGHKRDRDDRHDTGAVPATERPSDNTGAVPVRALTLSAIAEHAKWDAAVRRRDLSAGDRVMVTTKNSVYSIWVLGGDQYAVCGGWFDQHGLSPATIKINGCTYGQSAIRHDVVASPGLFLEFGNNVQTTRIQQVHVERNPTPPVVH